eukprot:147681-Pleurochrysis_carterae.AAC.1
MPSAAQAYKCACARERMAHKRLAHALCARAGAAQVHGTARRVVAVACAQSAARLVAVHEDGAARLDRVVDEADRGVDGGRDILRPGPRGGTVAHARAATRTHGRACDAKHTGRMLNETGAHSAPDSKGRCARGARRERNTRGWGLRACEEDRSELDPLRSSLRLCAWHAAFHREERAMQKERSGHARECEEKERGDSICARERALERMKA